MLNLLFRDFFTKNDERRYKESSARKEQLKKLYIDCDIVVPVKWQLEHAAEVVDCYLSARKTPPDIALRKLNYLKKTSRAKAIFVIIIISLFVYPFLFLKTDDSFYTPVYAVVLMFLCLIFTAMFFKQYEGKYDDKIMSRFNDNN